MDDEKSAAVDWYDGGEVWGEVRQRRAPAVSS